MGQIFRVLVGPCGEIFANLGYLRYASKTTLRRRGDEPCKTVVRAHFFTVILLRRRVDTTVCKVFFDAYRTYHHLHRKAQQLL